MINFYPPNSFNRYCEGGMTGAISLSPLAEHTETHNEFIRAYNKIIFVFLVVKRCTDP